jgi:hypothetical protein
MRDGQKKLQEICGAKNRKGLPCQCKLLLKGGKCKFHGGMSTGPRTEAGKKKSIASLRAGWIKWRIKVIEKASTP